MSRARIGFRGFDCADPNAVLKEGFNPMKPDSIKYGGGVDPNSAICVSWRFSAACYFPTPRFGKSQEDTWIFIVNVPLPEAGEDKIFLSAADFKEIAMNKNQQSFVNTHGRQVLDILRMDAPKNNYLYEMLFVDEVAVNRVDQKNIIGYVKCHRMWNNPSDWTQGGNYQITGPVVYQSLDILDPSITAGKLEYIDEFLNAEIKLSQSHPQRLPSINSGYSKSKFKKPKEVSEIKIEISEEKYHSILQDLFNKKMSGEFVISDFHAIPKALHSKLLLDLEKKMNEFEQQQMQHHFEKLKPKSTKSAQEKFFMMVKKGKIKSIPLLLERNEIKIDDHDKSGYTALQLAAIVNDMQMMRLLFNLGAKVGAFDKKGYTTLHHIAAHGSPETFDLLIKEGANVNAKGVDDLTPLHLAVSKSNLATIKKLLDAKADIESKDKQGKTPFDYAIKGHQYSSISIFIACGVSAARLLENSKDDLQVNSFIIFQLLKSYIQIYDQIKPKPITKKQLERISQEEQEKKPDWVQAVNEIIKLAQVSNFERHKSMALNLFQTEKNVEDQEYLNLFSSPNDLIKEIIKTNNNSYQIRKL